MTIKTSSALESPTAPFPFPALRQHQDQTDCGDGPLVVLFTKKDRGIALSGVGPERIGREESWSDYDSTWWLKCSITLTSES